MRFTFKRAIAILTTAILVVSVFSGCTTTTPASTTTAGTTTKAGTTPAGTTAAATTKPTDGFSYPMKSGVTLTYWKAMHANPAALVTNYADLPLWKEAMLRTGVTLKFIHPATGQEKEVFNLMIASNDLTDMIYYGVANFSGGVGSALDSNIIANLNTSIDKWAPDFKSYLSTRPEISKQVKTDKGDFYMFPYIGQQPETGYAPVDGASWGPVWRMDWLKEANLAVPETVDEWYTALSTIGKAKNLPAPFTTQSPADVAITFIGAFGGYVGWYINDAGKVAYGPYDNAYKGFFQLMNKWYTEKLLDPNFVTNNLKAVDGNMVSGKSLVSRSPAGAGIGTYIPAAKATTPTYDLSAGKYPVQKKGDLSTYTAMTAASGANGTFISAKCTHMEEAVRFLNYGYSAAGQIFYNYGVEGVSYDLVGGKPIFKDFLLKDPKLAPAVMLSWYTTGHGPGFSGPQRTDVLTQYYTLPQQKTALDTWSTGSQKDHVFPPLTLTTAENTEFSKIMGDIQTYTDEMLVKFILGTEPISGFDAYMAKIKTLKIDRAVELYQAAYTRFLSR